MSSTYTIRAVTEEDKSQMESVTRDANVMKRKSVPNQVRMMLQFCSIKVAEDDRTKQIIGYVAYEKTEAKSPQPAYMYIHRFFVRDGHQGKGIGSALLQKVIQSAAKRGLPMKVHAETQQAKAFFTDVRGFYHETYTNSKGVQHERWNWSSASPSLAAARRPIPILLPTVASSSRSKGKKSKTSKDRSPA